MAVVSYWLVRDRSLSATQRSIISLYKGADRDVLQRIAKKFGPVHFAPALRAKAGLPCATPERRARTWCVQSFPCLLAGEGGTFTPTQWSVVVAAGESQSNPEASRAALANLCESYWPPLYTYLRARGYAKHDAEDLTQGFFAYLIERKIYRRTDPLKGKFRSFLLASLKNFVADSRDRECTLKRGHGQYLVPLSESGAEAAEMLLQTHSARIQGAPREDLIFERSWADTLVNTALERVAAAYSKQGKGELFQELKGFLTVGAAPMPAYHTLALRLNAAESTVRSHVTRLRARYREILREEVRRTVNTDAEIDGELRELLRVLTGPEGN